MAPYYPRRGKRSQQDTALMRLLLPLGHQIMQLPNKPPVTIALVVGKPCRMIVVVVYLVGVFAA